MAHPLDAAVWWHVYPLGACDAPIRDRYPGDEGHRLRRLTAWVDYAADLGATGLLLGPVFDSVAHGYDTLDHCRIDPRLGDDHDFAELIEACRARDLDVILDGVFNHVAREHRFVADGGPVARDDDGRAIGWEGDMTLAELDHDDPATLDFVVDVMEHWLERGAAGWRLDVAYAVPAEFWAAAVARVRERFPDAVFLGEMIHGDYADFAQRSELDTMTQYELWKAIWSSIKDANFFELSHALGRHQEFSSRARMQTFVGNHDVDRIATAVGATGSALAHAVVLTLPGLPSIYAGDERGVEGAKGEGFGADDALRPPLPASPLDVGQEGMALRDTVAAFVWLRRNNPWWATADLEVVDVANERLVYRLRAGDRAAEVALVLGEECSVRVTVDGEVVFAQAWG